MRIAKGTRLQFKAGSGRWRDVTAREEFDTNDEFWKLATEDGEFNPKGELCKLREFKAEENKFKLIPKEIDVWAEINERISHSNIKRYPWNLILGDSLTKTILRQKMKGKTAQETYDSILSTENFLKIKQAFPEHALKMEQNIFISVCARFGENNTALSLYRKEFAR